MHCAVAYAKVYKSSLCEYFVSQFGTYMHVNNPSAVFKQTPFKHMPCMKLTVLLFLHIALLISDRQQAPYTRTEFSFVSYWLTGLWAHRAV